MDVRLPNGDVIQGIPDGTTKAQLVQKLQSNGYDVPKEWMTTDDPQKEAPSIGRRVLNSFVGAGEAAANMASGMVAKPVSDVAGMAATAYEAATGAGGNPAAFKNYVQDKLTYQPKLDEGKALAEYNPLALVGKGVGAVANAAGDVADSALPGSGATQGMAGNFIREAIPQAVGVAGAKYAPQINSAAKAGANYVAGAVRTGAEDLMTSALKPTIKAHMSGDAKLAAKTLLDKGINATTGGTEKLQGMIDGINDQIAEKIKTSGATVSKQTVLKALDDVRAGFADQVDPVADLNAVNGVGTRFDNHPKLNTAKPSEPQQYFGDPAIDAIEKTSNDAIPVQTAQSMKQGTYRVLSKKYGQLGSADVEAQKALARGLKEEIAKAVPEVAGLNAEESTLIKTLKVTERRALMDLNKNPFGLSILTGNPAAWAAFMADKSALFKSIAARMANVIQKSGVKVAGAIPDEFITASSIDASPEAERVRRKRERAKKESDE
jgi:hypothetical protein